MSTEKNKFIKAEYTFVSSADDNFVEGLRAVLLSFLNSQPRHLIHNLLIVDGGISKKNKIYIEESLVKFSKLKVIQYELTYCAPSLERWKKFPPHWGSYAVYGYLEAFKEVKTKYYLMVDSDMLHFKNVEEILEPFNQSQNQIAAVQDTSFQILANDVYSSFYSDNKFPQATYFNTGYLLINLERFSPDSFYQFVDEIDVTYSHQKFKGKKGFLFDQSLLNGFICGDAYELDSSWNYLALQNKEIAYLSEPTNLHYVSQPKPWDQMINTSLSRHLSFESALNHFTGKGSPQLVSLSTLTVIILKFKALFFSLIGKRKKALKFRSTIVGKKELTTLQQTILSWCK